MNGWLLQTTAYWRSGGMLLLPLACVCLGILALFFRSRDLLMHAIRDAAVAKNALEPCVRGTTSDALAMRMRDASGGIAAMIFAAVNDVRRGSLPREAFAAREEECLDLLSRDLPVLAALTAVAPLLGLLGTVMGMIQTFGAVAATGGDTATRVAEGISQALITTQFGLVVAVPGVFGLARLQRMQRNARVVMTECRFHALQALELGTEL